MRIQHAVYVYWVLHLNSCCETIPVWAGGNGSGEEEPPPAPLLLHPHTSVLVDPKDPHSVELRQFGDQDAHQGDGVDDEVYPVVLGVKAG